VPSFNQNFLSKSKKSLRDSPLNVHRAFVLSTPLERYAHVLVPRTRSSQKFVTWMMTSFVY